MDSGSAAGAAEQAVRPCLVDGHVHVQPSFDRGVFLSCAQANLDAGARALGLPLEVPGVLLLTETSGEHVFRRWQEQGEPPLAAAGWSFPPGRDELSLTVYRHERPALVLIAGRQLRTRDGLEVLAIGTDRDLPDALSMLEAIAAVREAGALPVVPWGFGKWWLRRARPVAEALAEAPRPLFLGDNGGRLEWAPPPRLFDIGRRLGVFTLPGSDPLPLPGHERRAGGYGFVLDAGLDLARPTTSLREGLIALREQPRRFGRLERPWAFVGNQVRMQLAKRL